jgi:hypothetical protein
MPPVQDEIRNPNNKPPKAEENNMKERKSALLTEPLRRPFKPSNKPLLGINHGNSLLCTLKMQCQIVNQRLHQGAQLSLTP